MKSLLQGKERSAKRARKEKDESNSGAPLSPQLLAHLNEHFGTDLSEDSLLSFDEPTSPHRQWDSPAREQVPIRSEKPSCPPPGNYGSPKPSPFLPNESLGVSETLTPRRRKHSRRASISRNFDMDSYMLGRQPTVGGTPQRMTERDSVEALATPRRLKFTNKTMKRKASEVFGTPTRNLFDTISNSKQQAAALSRELSREFSCEFSSKINEIRQTTDQAAAFTRELSCDFSAKILKIPTGETPTKRFKRPRKIFEKELAWVMKAQARTPLSHLKIPVVVEECVEYLMAQGLETQGIFRVSAGRVQVDAAVKRYNLGHPNPLGEDGGPALAASVLKKFLRDLPTPLLTYTLYDDFLNLFTRPEEEKGEEKIELKREEVLEETKRLISRLPRLHYLTLKPLLLLFNAITDRSDVNLMSAANIAIVIAPNILKGEKVTIADCLSAIGTANTVVEFLIQNTSAILEYCDPLFEAQPEPLFDGTLMTTLTTTLTATDNTATCEEQETTIAMTCDDTCETNTIVSEAQDEQTSTLACDSRGTETLLRDDEINKTENFEIDETDFSQSTFPEQDREEDGEEDDYDKFGGETEEIKEEEEEEEEKEKVTKDEIKEVEETVEEKVLAEEKETKGKEEQEIVPSLMKKDFVSEEEAENLGNLVERPLVSRLQKRKAMMMTAGGNQGVLSPLVDGKPKRKGSLLTGGRPAKRSKFGGVRRPVATNSPTRYTSSNLEGAYGSPFQF